jgi:hypothetical protein
LTAAHAKTCGSGQEEEEKEEEEEEEEELKAHKTDFKAKKVEPNEEPQRGRAVPTSEAQFT